VDELSGRATRVQGDPAHPVTRGFLCGKVARYLDRVYSPHRVLYPMRRIAPKGADITGRESESFARISWDDALSTIADNLTRVARDHGPESILPYSYAGNMALLGFGSMDRRFFHRIGACQLDRTICSTAGEAGIISVYGRKVGTAPEDFAHAKLILAWGANIHGNNIHLWPFIEQARRNGARLIVIDPYVTRTAKLADWHIPIHMGTDTALALGLMHVIFAEKLEDAAYLADHTIGADDLRARAAEYPPERVAAVTGIPAADIVKLAREYARAQPSVIRLNYGIQRGEFGGTATRAVCILPCVTGAWRHRGGGLQLSVSGAFRFNNQRLEMPELAQSSPTGRLGRLINMNELGAALNDFDNPPVHALFVYNSNPAAVAPDHNAVTRGMRRSDLFTVVHEQFFTDTTNYADILLPATTFLEHTDIQGAYGHYFVGRSNAAIAPIGEARPNVWLFSQLAQRMGFTESCFHDSTDDLIAQALDSPNPWLAGITPQSLRDNPTQPLRLPTNGSASFTPFAHGNFFTASGKAEIYSAQLAAEGKDPLPAWTAPAESRHGSLAKTFPLELLARKADNFLNSSFANLDWNRDIQSRTVGFVELHPDDAAPRNITDGDLVEVFNDRGTIQLHARVESAANRRTHAGMVVALLDWAKFSASGVNINALTSQKLTDMGAAATFYSVLCEVRKISPSSAQSPA
jgi:anaerobic selenocysteine-containing dehydrogenase